MVMEPADSLLAEMSSTPAMDRVFSAGQQVQSMLRFEWALSAALEDCGMAPAGSSLPLASLLQTDFLTIQRAEQLRTTAPSAGNLAIPFVKLLTQVVTETNPDAARSIHTGATSQDVLDTALVLQIQQAFALLAQDLDATLSRSIALAREHAATIQPGRTWLQMGPPITLGLQFAGYAAALRRHQLRLQQAESRAVTLQFGGAVGTLASLGDDGPRVSHALAQHLQLPEPLLPWHCHRDNLAEVATTLGLLTGTLGKMARDISLSMQTEVAELSEPAGEGRGGSSTMPHKRNPVACAAVLAAAIRVPPLVATMLSAMPQEHQRGIGGWQAEWATLPQIFRLTAGALSQIRAILDGLEVHAARMTDNLHITRGLIFAEAVSAALAPHIGRPHAHRLLEDASRRVTAQGRPLLEILSEHPEVTHHLSANDLRGLFEPGNYLGSTKFFIDRTLAALTEIKEPDQKHKQELP